MKDQLTEYDIDYSAINYSQAFSYLDYRYIQLLKFGIRVTDEIVDSDTGAVVSFYTNNSSVNPGRFMSAYLLKSQRGFGNYLKMIQKYMSAVITLQECRIVSYLDKFNVYATVLNHSKAYEIIQDFYTDNRAKRTNVPLIYHIEEGCGILETLNADQHTKDAFCLHPLFQEDASFVQTLERMKNDLNDFGEISRTSLILAAEYRNVANSYLSKGSPKRVASIVSKEIRQMLIADKVQNYKDFLLYHAKSHPNRKRLDLYFKNWFDILNVEYKDIVPAIILPDFSKKRKIFNQ